MTVSPTARRQALPPTAAGGPHTIVATASSGATKTLTHVLFGEAYLCGGQSNMVRHNVILPPIAGCGWGPSTAPAVSCSFC